MTDVSLTQDENIQQELGIIFGHVKNLMFLEKTNRRRLLKHVDRAHDILKTISLYNKLDRKDTSK